MIIQIFTRSGSIKLDATVTEMNHIMACLSSRRDLDLNALASGSRLYIPYHAIDKVEIK